ncbi:MAG: hypothetical protein LBI78_06930 [Campylobacteraceae bacterium]|jgi:hypothetical protein|nr:hypothetical protein [Campylobacteraceae bacterium]
MKAIKTTVIISLAIMLSAVNANAWGKKEQGVLIGASAALLLPPLLQLGNNNRNHHYVRPTRHVQQPVQYVQPIQYIQPQQTTYIIQPQKYDFPHRQHKNHNYINKKDYASERIIIEHSDGSKTIIEK